MDSSGNFMLEIEVQGIRQVFLQIEHYSLGLFIEPDAHYVLDCDSIKVSDQYRPMYNNDPLLCRIVTEPDPGLNALISDFNLDFNEFIMREFGGVYQRRNTNIIKEFKTQRIDEISQYEAKTHQDYLIMTRVMLNSPELMANYRSSVT